MKTHSRFSREDSVCDLCFSGYPAKTVGLCSMFVRSKNFIGRFSMRPQRFFVFALSFSLYLSVSLALSLSDSALHTFGLQRIVEHERAKLLVILCFRSGLVLRCLLSFVFLLLLFRKIEISTFKCIAEQWTCRSLEVGTLYTAVYSNRCLISMISNVCKKNKILNTKIDSDCAPLCGIFQRNVTFIAIATMKNK